MHLTPVDLIYAATSRCPCGAGLAYRRNAKPYGDSAHWDCSAILTGAPLAKGVTHTDRLPFAFYEIKSEQQPSANGATTRPAEDAAAVVERGYAEAEEEYGGLVCQLDDNMKQLQKLTTEQEAIKAKMPEIGKRLRPIPVSTEKSA